MQIKTMNNQYVVIMAGGVGSRFWPASREDNPKQFHDILGVGKSLIRMTFERFRKLCSDDHILVVTNEKYKSLVLQHLPELSENQVLCEPSRNNTAPSVAYTAFRLHAMNAEANFVIAPSDALIFDEETFIQTISAGLEFTQNHDAILTLGIKPTSPHTGYGYIQCDVENLSANSRHQISKVNEFKEKPDLNTAEQYYQKGNYLWNAGIFLFRTSTILDSFKKYAPEIFALLSQGQNVYNTVEESAFINEYYPKTPGVSVDYAIMEKADNVYTIPSDFGWSDVGSWSALHENLTNDKNGNVVQADVSDIEASRNSLFRLPKDKILVARGLEDFIVVDEGDVLLIYPKSDEQDIKKVRARLEDANLKDFL